MKKHSGDGGLHRCIVVNSTVYFVIAYYFVVFSYNLFSIMLGKALGFEGELYYYGFVSTGKVWTRSDIILVFFVVLVSTRRFYSAILKSLYFFTCKCCL